jgi:hypothetical protein
MSHVRLADDSQSLYSKQTIKPSSKQAITLALASKQAIEQVIKPSNNQENKSSTSSKPSPHQTIKQAMKAPSISIPSNRQRRHLTIKHKQVIKPSNLQASHQGSKPLVLPTQWPYHIHQKHTKLDTMSKEEKVISILYPMKKSSIPYHTH